MLLAISEKIDYSKYIYFYRTSLSEESVKKSMCKSKVQFCTAVSVIRVLL